LGEMPQDKNKCLRGIVGTVVKSPGGGSMGSMGFWQTLLRAVIKFGGRGRADHFLCYCIFILKVLQFLIGNGGPSKL